MSRYILSDTILSAVSRSPGILARDLIEHTIAAIGVDSYEDALRLQQKAATRIFALYRTAKIERRKDLATGAIRLFKKGWAPPGIWCYAPAKEGVNTEIESCPPKPDYSNISGKELALFVVGPTP